MSCPLSYELLSHVILLDSTGSQALNVLVDLAQHTGFEVFADIQGTMDLVPFGEYRGHMTRIDYEAMRASQWFISKSCAMKAFRMSTAVKQELLQLPVHRKIGHAFFHATSHLRLREVLSLVRRDRLDRGLY